MIHSQQSTSAEDLPLEARDLVTPSAQQAAPTQGDASPSPEASKKQGSNWTSLLRELVETVVLTLVIFLLIRTVVQNFRVEGMSMEPNFHDGQFLLINKLAYRRGEPQRGDVVVFHYPRDPSRDFIKRVVGLPGDVIEIQNGEIYVNGQLTPDRVPINDATYSSQAVELGSDEMFVLGDNRPNSSDSHSWGPLSLDLVVGKVLLSYWPPGSWDLVRYPPPSDELQSAAGT